MRDSIRDDILKCCLAMEIIVKKVTFNEEWLDIYKGP